VVTDPQQPTSRRAARDAAAAPRGRDGGDTADGKLPRARIGLIAAGLAVVFLLLGTGAVFAGVAVGKNSVAVPTPAGTGTNAPTRDVPGGVVAAAVIPTCSISKLASAAALKTLYGSVVNPSTGTSLYTKLDGDAQPPASGEKVLTGAAAIAKLGPNFRITTKVVDGVTPGSITLVGAGDATLSSGASNVYGGAPTMASLAAKTLAAYNAAHPGVPITQVVLDASYWDPGDNWDNTVPRTELTGGFLSETTALQVDGDRANPQAQISPRGTDPVMHAGQAFAAALGLPGISIITGQEENGAPTLASVQSEPVYVLVKQMLLNSDNTLAEMLARIVSVKEALSGSSASLAQAIPTALAKYGLDTGNISVQDGSGESKDNAITPLFMAKFMGLVSEGKNGLQYLAAGLPIAGKSGSLLTRFTGANSVAVGQVHAKPGFIANAYSLSGYVTAKDGTKLSFAFFAVGSGISASANPALDSLATAVYNCGANLTND
jgi:D-alanyl-D-alanine carboxypeptidase/D-alanyl-D-alanine-endopeptidase (penicillin-binding protein 4)